VSSVPRFRTPGKMSKNSFSCARLIGITAIVSITALLNFAAFSQAQTAAKKPNIIIIMGDDVGWFNVGAIGV
jgi:hypothetical protein